MPVTMSGAPLAKSRDTPFLPFGSFPHQTIKTDMHYDATRGGWVQADDNRGGQPRALPPHWIQPSEKQVPAPKAKRDPRHFEMKHFGSWQLDMKGEQELGLAPPDWSVSSSMNDVRPNGQALFDARFHGGAMGRARGGYSMVADARGMEATAGKLEKAQNLDSAFWANDMSDETELARVSAEQNKFGNNTNMAVFQSNELAMAGMSALQRATDTSKIDFD